MVCLLWYHCHVNVYVCYFIYFYDYFNLFWRRFNLEFDFKSSLFRSGYVFLQLEKLLADVRNVAFETLDGLPSECQWLSKHLSKCALFVCNKWDHVPEKEAKDVENHVASKLQSCWPGVDPKLQIMHMSTANASKAQKHGYITKEFSNLMNGIKALVEKSVGARMEIHWK